MTTTAQQRRQAQECYARWQRRRADLPEEPDHAPDAVALLFTYLVGFVFGALVASAAWWLAGGV